MAIQFTRPSWKMRTWLHFTSCPAAVGGTRGRRAMTARMAAPDGMAALRVVHRARVAMAATAETEATADEVATEETAAMVATSTSTLHAAPTAVRRRSP